jgi:hypothetical protein
MEFLAGLGFDRGDRGYAEDPLQAAYWYERSAAGGNPMARAMLAYHYHTGYGRRVDRRRALILWETPFRTGAGIQERKLLRFPHPRPLLLQGPGQVAPPGVRPPSSPSPEEALLRLPAEGSIPAQVQTSRLPENSSRAQVGPSRTSGPSSRPLRPAEGRPRPSAAVRASPERPGRSGEGQAEGAAPQARTSAETRKEEIAPGCEESKEKSPRRYSGGSSFWDIMFLSVPPGQCGISGREIRCRARQGQKIQTLEALL